jgi:hypothetical protein
MLLSISTFKSINKDYYRPEDIINTQTYLVLKFIKSENKINLIEEKEAYCD